MEINPSEHNTVCLILPLSRQFFKIQERFLHVYHCIYYELNQAGIPDAEFLPGTVISQ